MQTYKTTFNLPAFGLAATLTLAILTGITALFLNATPPDLMASSRGSGIAPTPVLIEISRIDVTAVRDIAVAAKTDTRLQSRI